MPDLIELSTFHSESGYLTVFEKLMPGTIKRAYYLYATNRIPRGGHRYRTTWNAMICLHGWCRVYVHDGDKEELYTLNKPHQCLILEPRDWGLIEIIESYLPSRTAGKPHYSWPFSARILHPTSKNRL